MSELFIRFMGFLWISECQFSRARFGGGGGGTSDGGDGSGGGCSCRGCRRHLRRHLMARCRVERSWGPLVINTNDQAVLSSPASILHHLKWVAISRAVLCVPVPRESVRSVLSCFPGVKCTKQRLLMDFCYPVFQQSMSCKTVSLFPRSNSLLILSLYLSSAGRRLLRSPK